MSRARRAKHPVLGEKVATAKVRYHGAGPRKVRLIADLIRGLSVNEAQAQLGFLHKPSAAPMIQRLLKSAVSNAEHEGKRLDPEQLVIGTIVVDSGPFQKRIHARAYGRGAPIRKRTSHVTVELYTRPGAA